MMVSVQKGDSATYRQLLEEISKHLKPYLIQKVRNSSDADEILQEILMSLHKARHTYDQDLAFKPWLYTIVQRRLVDFWRKESKKGLNSLLVDDYDISVLQADIEISAFDVKRLNQAMSQLSDQQQKIVKYLKFEGKSIKEVAQKLKVSESVVKVSAHRSYKILFTDLGGQI